MKNQTINFRDPGTRQNFIASLMKEANEGYQDLTRVLYKPKNFDRLVRDEIAAIRKTMTQDQNDETPDKKLLARASDRVRARIYEAADAKLQEARVRYDRAQTSIRAALAVAQSPDLEAIELPTTSVGYGAEALVPFLKKIIQQNAMSEARATASLLTPRERLMRLADADPEMERELITVLEQHVQAHLQYVQSPERHRELADEKRARLGRNLTVDEIAALTSEHKQEQAFYETGLTAVREKRLTDRDRHLRDEWTTREPELDRAITSAAILLHEAKKVQTLPTDPADRRPAEVVQMPIAVA